MGTPSLVAVVFGGNTICLRRHWGGYPEIVGRQVLGQLALAKEMKPRSHFHTGSWLIRLLMADGADGGSGLPTYEAEGLPEGVWGDWERAYIFKALPDAPLTEGAYTDVGNHWSIGYVENAGGEGLPFLERAARWFSEAEFGAFVEAELVIGLATGRVCEIQPSVDFLQGMQPGTWGN